MSYYILTRLHQHWIKCRLESLDEIKGKKIYFLLKAKCKKIARELEVEYLDIVFKRSDHAELVPEINNQAP